VEYEETMKPQSVRLIDVFLLGPFMIWAGYELRKRKSPSAGYVLAMSGLGTVLYNAQNYLDEAQ